MVGSIFLVLLSLFMLWRMTPAIVIWYRRDTKKMEEKLKNTKLTKSKRRKY